MGRAVTVGVSLKMYFGHRDAVAWLTRVADRVGTHPAVAGGRVRVFVIPTFLQLLPAREILAATPIRVGAQDCADADTGAFTGEVSAAELAEVGVSMVEIGHAERRRLFGETDRIVAAKTATALRHGVEPVLCVGEDVRGTPDDAAAHTLAQLDLALGDASAGAVTVAYEPVWAIGADEPASTEHIDVVTRALRSRVDALPERSGSTVVYGGSAGPGLLSRLDDAADGLFLGRFAHDVDAFVRVVEEADAVAARRQAIDA